MSNYDRHLDEAMRGAREIGIAVFILAALIGIGFAIFRPAKAHGVTFPETSPGLKISCDTLNTFKPNNKGLVYRFIVKSINHPTDSVFKDGFDEMPNTPARISRWFNKVELPSDSLLQVSVKAQNWAGKWGLPSDTINVHFAHVYIPPVSDFPYTSTNFGNWTKTGNTFWDNRQTLGWCLVSFTEGSIYHLFRVGETKTYRFTLTYSGMNGSLTIGNKTYAVPSRTFEEPGAYGWKTFILDLTIPVGECGYFLSWPVGFTVKSISVAEAVEGDEQGPDKIQGVNVSNQP